MSMFHQKSLKWLRCLKNIFSRFQLASPIVFPIQVEAVNLSEKNAYIQNHPEMRGLYHLNNIMSLQYHDRSLSYT